MPEDWASSVEGVNALLAQWNPLNVPEEAAKFEYESYALELAGQAHRGADLVQSLIELLEGFGIEAATLTPTDYNELRCLSQGISTAIEINHGQ